MRVVNTTLLVGTEEEDVNKVIEVIRKFSAKRKQIVFTPEPYIGVAGDMSSYPEEIETGGATIFVIDVEKFEKV